MLTMLLVTILLVTILLVMSLLTLLALAHSWLTILVIIVLSYETKITI